jgi:predicted O-methyltransferase YrrM
VGGAQRRRVLGRRGRLGRRDLRAEGLDERGVLTSVEPDAHRHGLATQAYQEAGVTGRIRAIEGDPAEVLPRLADGAYDLVLLQSADDPDHLDHALRLARPGGLLAVRGVLQEGARAVVRGLVGDTEPSVLERLSEHDGLDTTLLPVDEGIVLARRLHDEDADGSDADA